MVLDIAASGEERRRVPVTTTTHSHLGVISSATSLVGRLWIQEPQFAQQHRLLLSRSAAHGTVGVGQEGKAETSGRAEPATVARQGTPEWKEEEIGSEATAWAGDESQG